MTEAGTRAGGQRLWSDESSLLAGIRVLRERWWLIAASILVCLGAAIALSATSSKQYTATATLLVRSSDLAALVDPTRAQSVDPARQTANTLSLLKSGTVAASVKSRLHLPDSVPDLQQRVDAVAQPNSDLIQLSISDRSPSKATATANAFANALVGYLTQQDQAQIAAGQAQITGQLNHLSATNSSARSILEQALRQVVALRAVTNGNVQVVDPAQVPSSPSSPKVKRDVAVGGVLGLVLGLALVFLLDVFDRRIKTVEDFESLYGMPALTTVPFRRRSGAGTRERHAELEPFRILRDGLAYASLSERAHVILVTSAVPSEGKTRVASGLARAIAAAGRRVALIEVDLHRPAALREFGLRAEGRGLTTALVEGISARDLLVGVPNISPLGVLPSGPLAPNSAELLRSSAMDNVLDDLGREFEFIVLDGAPLLPVADTQVLLANPKVDVCLVVGRPYLTTRDNVRSTVAILERYPLIGVGLAVNAVKERSSDYYYYPGGHENGAPAAPANREHVVASNPDSS